MKQKDIVKRLMTYIKSGRLMLVLSSVTAVVSSALGILIPFLAGRAIDAIGNADNKSLVFNLGIMLGVIAVATVLQYVLSRVNNKLSYDVTLKIRNDVYGKMKRVPISYIDRVSTGAIQSMVISDCETVGDGLLLFLNQFFAGIVAIVFTLIMMLSIDYRIALFVLVFTPVSFIVSYMISSRTFNSFKKQADVRSKQTSFISEMTKNFRIVHVYDMNDQICDEFDSINGEYKKISGWATFLSSITNPSTRFVNALIYAGVAFIASQVVTGGNLTIGSMTSLLAYASQFMKPFNDLSAVYTEMTDSFACLSRIFSFLDEEELDDDLTAADTNGVWEKRGHFCLEFRNVTFSYVPGQPVLNNVSFKVDAGCSCAIVGPTGCGKTTLINLLMRFYEPDSGEILINNVNIKLLKRNVLRRYVGVVAQDTWFKDASIIENIKYGSPDITDEEAAKTAQISGASSFIRRLPHKYDEDIDSQRDDISEGQRQLLSITRAMASDPSILILDEATSSVDILTEVKIQKAVKELLNGRTSVIIAHRLSTIVDADQIVVLDKGKVLEIGKHEDLINNGGFYSKLYNAYTE